VDGQEALQLVVTTEVFRESTFQSRLPKSA